VRQDVRVDDGQGIAAQAPAADGPSGAGSAGPRGWRARVRRTPLGAQLLKLAVFVVGLLFILLGLALAALPGPLDDPADPARRLDLVQ
jgi:hypothetical protein